MEEPEHAEWIRDVYEVFEDSLGEKLMYSSDYPHWDFDPPDVLPASLPLTARRKILAETASQLYGIPLRDGAGLPLAETVVSR
jgi:predicted TIM-barrel fold metal-dependent hydrolase